MVFTTATVVPSLSHSYLSIFSCQGRHVVLYSPMLKKSRWAKLNRAFFVTPGTRRWFFSYVRTVNSVLYIFAKAYFIYNNFGYNQQSWLHGFSVYALVKADTKWNEMFFLAGWRIFFVALSRIQAKKWPLCCCCLHPSILIFSQSSIYWKVQTIASHENGISVGS